MSDFNFRLNKQGPVGPRGLVGPEGFSPEITEEANTPTEYKLRVTNKNETFVTPNLMIDVADQGGTYIRKDEETGELYYGIADQASELASGEVKLASDTDIEQDSDTTAITPKKVKDLLKSGTGGDVDKAYVDAADNNLQQQISAADGEIAAIETDLLDVDTSIKGLGTRVAANETEIDSLGESVETLDTDVDELQSDVADLKTADNEIRGLISTNTDDIESNTQSIEGFQTALGLTNTSVQNLSDNKQDLLESGINIKTINNASILGSGNIEISGGSGSGTNDYNQLSNKPSINGRELVGDVTIEAGVGSYTDLTDKPTLSGTTIEGEVTLKTINGQELVGSGDIVIEGGGGGVAQVQADLEQTDDTAVDFIKNKAGHFPETAIDLADTNISSLRYGNSKGFYKQLSNARATLANGYPWEGEACSLEILPAGMFQGQEYATQRAVSIITNQQAIRTCGVVGSTETWSAWKFGAITTDLEGKQDELVSGTNIKTINNESILGSGNITIEGGGGSIDPSVLESKQDKLTPVAPIEINKLAQNCQDVTFSSDGNTVTLKPNTLYPSTTWNSELSEITLNGYDSNYPANSFYGSYVDIQYKLKDLSSANRNSLTFRLSFNEGVMYGILSGNEFVPKFVINPSSSAQIMFLGEGTANGNTAILPVTSLKTGSTFSKGFNSSARGLALWLNEYVVACSSSSYSSKLTLSTAETAIIDSCNCVRIFNTSSSSTLQKPTTNLGIWENALLTPSFAPRQENQTAISINKKPVLCTISGAMTDGTLFTEEFASNREFRKWHTSNKATVKTLKIACPDGTLLFNELYDYTILQYYPELITLDLTECNIFGVSSYQYLAVSQNHKLVNLLLAPGAYDIYSPQFGLGNTIKTYDLRHISYNKTQQRLANIWYTDPPDLKFVGYPRQTVISTEYSYPDTGLTGSDISDDCVVDFNDSTANTLNGLYNGRTKFPNPNFKNLVLTNPVRAERLMWRYAGVEFDGSSIDVDFDGDFDSAFYECTNLEKLVLGNKNKVTATSLRSFVSGCSALEHVDMSNVEINSDTDLSRSFYKVPTSCEILVYDQTAADLLAAEYPDHTFTVKTA